MFIRIPPGLHNDNRGEKAVNRELQQLFPNKKYFSIHSQPLAEHPNLPEGEADFILVTDMGIFCLEVKGGEVRRDGGNWFYSGSWKGSRSPFEQAKQTTYPIIKTLEKVDKKRRNKFVIGWGVIFPDIVFDDIDPGWSPAHICDARQFPHGFENYIRSLADYWKKRLSDTVGFKIQNTPNLQDIQWAVRAIRPNIAHFSLLELEESKHEVILLEDKLQTYLDQVVGSVNCRSVISGTAGTGKTVLLREAVARLPSNQKILFLCFNATLAREFKYLFSHFDNVTALHYEALKRSVSDNTNVATKNLEENFQDAVVAADSLGYLKRFDWILIDEAQDFLNEGNWEAIRYMLEGGESRERYIIAFDGQAQAAMYDNYKAEFFERLQQTQFSLPLIRNYRNPDNLARIAGRLIGENEESVETARSFIKPPKLTTTKGAPSVILQNLDTTISQLVKRGVKPSEITILTFKRRKDSCLKGVTNIAGQALVDLKLEITTEGNQFKGVSWSTVSSFKGLENEYILLIEGQNYNEESDWWSSQLYVALTRTKTQFHYFGSRDDACWKGLMKND